MLLQRPESVELDASHHSSKPCIAATPRPLVAIFQLPEDGFACPETLGGGVDLGLVGQGALDIKVRELVDEVVTTSRVAGNREHQTTTRQRYGALCQRTQASEAPT